MFETAVYIKSTNTAICLNWQSCESNTWKWVALKVLINSAYNIFSTNFNPANEWKHIEGVFQYRKSFCQWAIRQILEQVHTKWKHGLNRNVKPWSSDNNLSKTSAAKFAYATLPHKGKFDEKVLKSLKSSFKKLLTKKVETRLACTGTKLRSHFAIKGRTKLEHQHDFVHQPDRDYNYIWGVGRRFLKRFGDYGSVDHKSQMLKYLYEKARKNVSSEDFRIHGNGFSQNIFKRNISEALFIQQLRPSLNAQICLFPWNCWTNMGALDSIFCKLKWYLSFQPLVETLYIQQVFGKYLLVFVVKLAEF